MDAVTLEIISEILNLAITQGIPAVQAGIAALNKPTVTLADIQTLGQNIQFAEAYWAAKGAPTSATPTETPAS